MQLRKDLNYWQVIDLPDGTTTPGKADHRRHPAFLNIDKPGLLKGKRVLDVAANDGFWSFWAEQQGAADVLATDVECIEDYDWGYAGPPAGFMEGKRSDLVFHYLHRMFTSKVRREALSVYDHDPAEVVCRDLVFCYGLIYHLRHPLLAIDALRRVCKGACIIETHALLCSEPAPLMAFYEDDVCQAAPTNWCGPTTSCMVHWMKSAGFDHIFIPKHIPGDRQLFIGAVTREWCDTFTESPNLRLLGEDYWKAAHATLNSATVPGEQLTVSLFKERLPEGQTARETPAEVVCRCYRTILGRKADERALANFVPQLEKGMPEEKLRLVLLTSPEMRQRLVHGAVEHNWTERLAAFLSQTQPALAAAADEARGTGPATVAKGSVRPGTPPGDLAPENTRLMVLSLPKAGTYLAAEMAGRLGMGHTHYHFSTNYVDVYDPNDLAAGRANPNKFRIHAPLEQTVRMLRAGEFAVGHLPCQSPVVHLMEGFRLVLCIREPRDILLSFMRFLYDTRRDNPEKESWYPAHDVAGFIRMRGPNILRTVRGVIPWANFADVFLLPFGRLKEDGPGMVRELSRFLNVSGEIDAEAVATQALSAQTLTRSGAHLELQWDDAAEAAFVEIGGPEVSGLVRDAEEGPHR